MRAFWLGAVNTGLQLLFAVEFWETISCAKLLEWSRGCKNKDQKTFDDK